MTIFLQQPAYSLCSDEPSSLPTCCTKLMMAAQKDSVKLEITELS